MAGIFTDVLGTVLDFGKDYGSAYIDDHFEKPVKQAPVYPTGIDAPVNQPAASPNVDFFGLPLNKTALMIAGVAAGTAVLLKLLK